MFRHTEEDRTIEINKCLHQSRIPINPYQMRDGRGIDFALCARDIIDGSVDAGSWGGCMFVIPNHNTSADDIRVVLDLRDEEYDLYHADKLDRKVRVQ